MGERTQTARVGKSSEMCEGLPAPCAFAAGLDLSESRALPAWANCSAGVARSEPIRTIAPGTRAGNGDPDPVRKWRWLIWGLYLTLWTVGLLYPSTPKLHAIDDLISPIHFLFAK